MTALITRPTTLRERAARCRDLASRAAAPDVAQELLEIAEEYEGDAANLEEAQKDTPAPLSGFRAG